MPLDDFTTFERVEKLAVEFKEPSSGSGILYIQKNNQKAAILTAAHVVQKVGTEFPATLVFRFHCNGVEESLTINNDTEKAEHIQTYDSFNEEYGDAAIITIEWKEWMNELSEINIGTPQIGDMIKIFAFPISTTRGDNQNRSIRLISGNITVSPDIDSCVFQIEYNNIPIGDGMEPGDFFKGCSGGGVATYRDGSYLIIGVFTRCMPYVSHGAVILANSGSVLQNLAKRCSFDLNIAPENYSIDSYTEDLSDSVREVLDYQLTQLSLGRDSFKDLPQYKISGLQLQCLENHHCNKYWSGRALYAVLLKILLGVPASSWERSIVTITETIDGQEKAQQVHIEQLCTEERMPRLIRQLIQSQDAFSSGCYENNTIFIINGNNSPQLRKRSRKECQNIVNDITRNTDSLCDKFSITDGDVKKISIAFVQNIELLVGIDSQQVLSGDQNFGAARAKEFLTKELQKLWN